MKRYPPIKPYAPCEPKLISFIGHKASDPEPIYYDIEVLGDSDYSLEEHFAEEDLPRPELPSKRYWEKLSLQDIVDLAPPGTKLSDIVFDLSFPRYLEYVEVSFNSLKRNLEAEDSAFNSAMNSYKHEFAAYEISLDKYNKDLSEYNEWEKQQEISELEKKLAKLKK